MGRYQPWSIRLLCLCVLLSNTYLVVDGLTTATTSGTPTPTQPYTTVTSGIDNSTEDASNSTEGETSSTPPSVWSSTEEVSTVTTPSGAAAKTAFNGTDWAVIGVTSAIPVVVFIISILMGIYRVRHEQNMLAKKMEENTRRGQDNMGFEN